MRPDSAQRPPMDTTDSVELLAGDVSVSVRIEHQQKRSSIEHQEHKLWPLKAAAYLCAALS